MTETVVEYERQHRRLLDRVAAHKFRKEQRAKELFQLEERAAWASELPPHDIDYYIAQWAKLEPKVKAHLEKMSLRNARRLIKKGLVFDWEVFQ